MASVLSDLSGIAEGDIICSVRVKPETRWKRKLQDKDGNEVNIHRLEVERSLNSGTNWILCLYKENRTSEYDKHIFLLDLDDTQVKVWKKPPST